MTTLLSPPPSDWGPPTQPDAPVTRWRRAWRGSAVDPAWGRPALVVLLAATAVLYLWGLGRSGWANTFYSGAVQAGTESWKAFFFGSSDAASSITVDKPPLALWVMELTSRVFGLSSWSVLAPQALEGVAAVAVVHATVKRWFGAGAGLLAGGVLALTPAAALMFRFNNPDALLALLLVGATWAMTRAIDGPRATRWLVLAGTLVGLGFMTKTLQAMLVVPALALAFLVAGSAARLGHRLLQLLAGGAALVVASLWWVAVVMAIPASARPYIGGSQDNSEWNLIFGYNGFGRLTGNETGSVGGGAAPGTTGRWGSTGVLRLFNSQFGGDASWLLPTALLLLVAGLAITVRRARTDRERAGLLLWGGSLVVTALTLSLGKGIIHPYYTVALAPGIGATVAIGATVLWRRRASLVARSVLAVAVVAAGVWALVLLGRTPHWLPWLRPTVLVGSVLAAIALLGWGGLVGRYRSLAAAAAVTACLAGVAGPAAYAVDTARHAESGALPSAGPSGQGGGFGGPGGPGFARGGRPGPGAGRFGGFGGGGVAGGPPAGFGGPPGAFGGPAGFGGPQAGFGAGGLPGIAPGGLPSGGFGGVGAGGVGKSPGGAGGGPGGILAGTKVSAALTAALQADAGRYRWVAAVVSAEQAASYQLAARRSVMPIGGFNGTDPSPTLAQFEADVTSGEIHYFIAGGGGPGGGRGGGSGIASAITSWVESHYTATTIGGTTVYDLTAPAG